VDTAFTFAKLLSAFGVPVALLIAIGNSLWQSHLQERQFRVSFFEKRFPVFVTLREFLVGGEKTVDQCSAFLRETKQGKFLFGKAFDDFVNEVYRKAHRIRTLNEQLQNGHPPDERQIAELQTLEAWWITAFTEIWSLPATQFRPSVVCEP
jgi:hypothetical protein